MALLFSCVVSLVPRRSSIVSLFPFTRRRRRRPDTRNTIFSFSVPLYPRLSVLLSVVFDVITESPGVDHAGGVSKEKERKEKEK